MFKIEQPSSACCEKNKCGSSEAESFTSVSENQIVGDEQNTIFKVLNMDCADEIKAINIALKVNGVYSVYADLMASTIKVTHSRDLNRDFLKKKINSTIVKVVEENSAENHNQIRIIKVAVCGVLLLLGLLLEKLFFNANFSNALFVVSIFVGGSLIFPKAANAIKNISLDMNVLMTAAVFGAIFIKEYSEATTVVFLFSLSELLESLSVQRARNAVQELFKIVPQKAIVVEADNSLREVNAEDVKINDTVRVKAGNCVPLDGIIVSGSANIDQAALTGESTPIFKEKDNEVFAGTLNRDGSIDVRVTKLFADTKISHVIKLVAEAQTQRAPAQQFVDKFAKIYTPVVFVLSILTVLIPVFFFNGDVNEWFYKALVLLVIACPCALVISTPISIVSALTALAKNGVLVKGGSHLEMLGKIKTIAFDKTGTLTIGKPEVKGVEVVSNYTQKEILEIAASIENHSSHPFAQAVIEFAAKNGISPLDIENFVNIPGKGIEATIKGHQYFLSNHKYVKEVNIISPELDSKLSKLEDKSFSLIIVGHKPHHDCTGEILGFLKLGDTLRHDVKNTILGIRDTGIRHIAILSGDNQVSANSIGNQVGADLIYGDLLPEDKVNKISDLKDEFKFVAMIGDGVNDAPAMASASLGISLGGIGTSAAIEASDITLMTDDLKQIAVAVNLGKRALNVIRFNIYFSILMKLLFLMLTMAGIANLWLAIIADTGATLLVTANSLRLLKTNSP